MNKVESAFLKSNIKKAIWYLECANKISPGSVDEKIIEELKMTLLLIKIKENHGQS
jgi:hypothetical protein